MVIASTGCTDKKITFYLSLFSFFVRLSCSLTAWWLQKWCHRYFVTVIDISPDVSYSSLLLLPIVP